MNNVFRATSVCLVGLTLSGMLTGCSNMKDEVKGENLFDNNPMSSNSDSSDLQTPEDLGYTGDPVFSLEAPPENPNFDKVGTDTAGVKEDFNVSEDDKEDNKSSQDSQDSKDVDNKSEFEDIKDEDKVPQSNLPNLDKQLEGDVGVNVEVPISAVNKKLPNTGIFLEDD